MVYRWMIRELKLEFLFTKQPEAKTGCNAPHVYGLSPVRDGERINGLNGPLRKHRDRLVLMDDNEID